MKLEDLTKEELLNFIEENEMNSGKYGLVWDREKEPEQIVVECDKQLPILEMVDNKSISDGSKNTNLLIEGDNFHSLTVLNYTHKESVDIIYIDPPYNTGNKDFMYNDKFIDVEDGYRHSKWLNFMTKRLKLAKNLLKEDGIIMISIDGNEIAQLMLLCDSIFGEHNKLSTQHIQVRYANKSLNEKKDFQEIIEYCLIYAKNSRSFNANKPTREYDLDKFNLSIIETKEPDKTITIGDKKVDIFLNGSYEITKEEGNIELFKETWLSGSIYSGTGHGKTYQKICEPRVEEDGLATLYKIYGLGEDGLGYRYMINPLQPNKNRGKMFTKVPVNIKDAILDGGYDKPSPIVNFYDFSPDFGNIRHEGGIGFNSGKKPIKMLKQLINYHPNKNAIVLDFFAGSGSTGHAVLDLNNDDDGNRSFIICTNNENNICEDVTYPRIKNVIEGYSGKEGLGGNLKYFKTDFVDNNNNRDQLYFDLTEKCIPMLCIKDNNFVEHKITDEYKIYTNEDKSKYTCIYYGMFGEKEQEFIDELKSIKEQKTVYKFSLSDTVDKEIFNEVENYNIEAIPYRIIEIYKQLVKLSKEN
ncbi:MAG: site-specific DNA-methyltransferase [Clostridia bacterium]|nr:site-specific DNA-methyltransferase [Clostridia bacterium]